MKYIMEFSAALFIAANSLMAWAYSPNYYGNYPYTEGWRYPSSYSDGCPQGSGQTFRKSSPPRTMAKTARPPYPKRPQYSGKKPVEQQYANLIVMFTKEDCPYCRYMMPIMKQVENKLGSKDIKFLYIDIAKNPQYPSQYGFSTVPQIVYFRDGKKLAAHGSADKTMTAAQVKEKIGTFFGDILFEN